MEELVEMSSTSQKIQRDSGRRHDRVKGSCKLVSMRCSYSRIAFATLLLLGQGLVALHAAEFGTDVHHHDGVLCSAILHEDHDIPIATRSGSWPAVDQCHANQALASAQGCVVCAFVLRPPATAPPPI